MFIDETWRGRSWGRCPKDNQIRTEIDETSGFGRRSVGGRDVIGGSGPCSLTKPGGGMFIDETRTAVCSLTIGGMAHQGSPNLRYMIRAFKLTLSLKPGA